MSERTMEQLKEIVDVGVRFGAWSWDDATAVDDAAVAAAAATLIDGATQASAKSSVNEAVLRILHAAGVEPQSDVSRAALAQLTGAPAPAPTPQPAPSPAQGAFGQAQASPAPVSEQAAGEAAPAVDSIEDIYPGYDDAKAADIKKAVLFSCADGSMSPEEWERVRAYEVAHEDRKTIRELQPEFKAPEPEPQSIAEAAALTPQESASADALASAAGVTRQPATGAFGGVVQPDNSVRVNALGADGDSIAAFYNGESISRAQQEGLPVPPQTTGEGVVMPIDITGTSEQELSRLATAYHSLFARTQWLISQEEGRERAAEQMEHDTHRDAYIRAYEKHKGEIPEGKAGPTALDAARKLAEKDADGNGDVHTWRTRKVRHGIDARELKALSTGYDKAVWRINEELERRARLQTSAMAAPR